MIRASVVHPAGDGTTFDHARYAQKRMALVQPRADVPNFTSIQPPGQISEIRA
jgi:hypothetical protein